MDVVPVIDLMGNQVVRAKMGQRHLYAPIQTPLAASSAARDVISGFLGLSPFKTIYIADLDAIEGRAPQDELISNLQAAFPGLTFWIDCGVQSPQAADAWLDSQKANLVIGSESWHDAEALRRYRHMPRVILSLDFRGDVFQGPQAILDDPELWPAHLIVMTLARVGSDAGPDFARLAAINNRAEGRAIYAAGGLRDAQDLRLLQQAGVRGVLVASALHDGRLNASNLHAIDS